MPYEMIGNCKFYSYVSASESSVISSKLKNSKGILTTPADLQRKGTSQALPERSVQREENSPEGRDSL